MRQACERHLTCKDHQIAVEKLHGFRVSRDSGSVVDE